ncbi:carbonic anhydrase family protein [Fructobacillus sp. M158]|uniref:carbonic anhydrase family protein n=1 Tax=Fructobacillus parabroussonetiae TaxID=2713174 RepID=UPI00200A965D|nr:carbonic anhydrase family protein [Fructobacillus parabroussonetiae]MCK8617506.1 carbonic anhydrase family protein [Fructobacillus parabroussonetiae]
MNKLDYHYQDVWRFTTMATCQSPIDVVAAKLQTGPAMVLDWSGLQTTALERKKQVIGDQFFCQGLLRIDQQAYSLIRFHVHDGAEHLFDGQAADAELHFVFQRPDGGTLVLAIFYEEEAEAPLRFQKIYHNQGQRVQLQSLLPADVSSVITYRGSLTTPPLKKDVDWILVKEKLGINPVDLATFKQDYPDNHRAVQPLNGRPVQQRPVKMLPKS